MEFAYLIVGIIVGAVAAWLIAKSKYNNDSGAANSPTNSKEFQELNNEKTRLEERSRVLAEEVSAAKTRLEEIRIEDAKKGERLARAEEAFKAQQEKLTEQKAELSEMKETFNKEFENIASKVLRQNSEEISKINSDKLNLTLKPLGERIKSFEDKMEQSGKDREGLKEQIKLLHDLNQRMADEAHNLTKALKGDAKKQGNWGEVVLERVLERSGLVKGQEYETQFSSENMDGQRIQPDVIIKLPEEKHIIVDAKVSLVAYEKFINADNDTEREKAIKEHILSVRSHIKGLNEKAYQTATDLNTPDFVLLFIPIEASFSLAVQADLDLFNYAWDKQIVVVSPSTLLATLRTIASIWKQEKQNKNAVKIAVESGRLYDKFVGFVDDMKKIEKSLTTTQNTYDDAMKKLTTGTGNLVKKADDIKKLGARATKELGDVGETEE